MSHLKTVLSLVVAGGLCACTAASQQSADAQIEPSKVVETVTSKVTAPMATVKPGANITLNSVLPKTMVAGEFQTVQLSLTDAYLNGSLEVNIKTSSGLRIFGGQDSQSFDMSKEGPHNFDVDVAADTDGVYFLNVFTTANGSARSFSVRVNVGNVTQKMFDDLRPASGELVESGTIRVMDADETIR